MKQFTPFVPDLCVSFFLIQMAYNALSLVAKRQHLRTVTRFALGVWDTVLPIFFCSTSSLLTFTIRLIFPCLGSFVSLRQVYTLVNQFAVASRAFSLDSRSGLNTSCSAYNFPNKDL